MSGIEDRERWLAATARTGAEEDEESFLFTGATSFWNEDASLSRAINRKRHYVPRNENIDKAIEAGLYPPEVVQSFTRRDEGAFADIELGDRFKGELDYSGLAEWGRAMGLDTQLDSEIDDNIRSDLKARREEVSARLASASPAEKAKFFAGNMGASITDPVVLASMAIPVAGASRLPGSVARAAARTGGSVAAATAATELALQAQVVAYKEEIDSPYSWTDGLFQTAVATVLGGGIGAGLGAVGQRAANANKRGHLDEIIATAPEGSEQKAAAERTLAAMEVEPIYRPTDDVAPETTRFGVEDDVGTEARELAATRADAIERRDLPMLDDDGVETTTGQNLDTARSRAEITEKVITCVTGAADG